MSYSVPSKVGVGEEVICPQGSSSNPSRQRKQNLEHKPLSKTSAFKILGRLEHKGMVKQRLWSSSGQLLSVRAGQCPRLLPKRLYRTFRFPVLPS